jgi:hypothetical protein
MSRGAAGAGLPHRLLAGLSERDEMHREELYLPVISHRFTCKAEGEDMTYLCSMLAGGDALASEPRLSSPVSSSQSIAEPLLRGRCII